MTHSVEIAGVTYPIAFPIGALLRFERKSKKSAFAFMAEMSEGKQNIEDFVTLIHSGLEAGAAKSNGKLDLTVEALADNLELADIERVTAVLNASMPSASSDAIGGEPMGVMQAP